MRRWKEKDIDRSIQCQVELSEENLKFIQINPNLLINRSLTLPSTRYEHEEKILEQKDIFLFSR